MRHNLHIAVEWISLGIMILCIGIGSCEWLKPTWGIVLSFFIFLGIWSLNKYLFKKWAFSRIENNISKLFRQGEEN